MRLVNEKKMKKQNPYYESQLSNLDLHSESTMVSIQFIGSESGRTKQMNIHPSQVSVISSIMNMTNSEQVSKNEELKNINVASTKVGQEISKLHLDSEWHSTVRVFDGCGYSTKWLNVNERQLSLFSRMLDDSASLRRARFDNGFIAVPKNLKSIHLLKEDMFIASDEPTFDYVVIFSDDVICLPVFEKRPDISLHKDHIVIKGRNLASLVTDSVYRISNCRAEKKTQVVSDGFNSIPFRIEEVSSLIRNNKRSEAVYRLARKAIHDLVSIPSDTVIKTNTMVSVMCSLAFNVSEAFSEEYKRIYSNQCVDVNNNPLKEHMVRELRSANNSLSKINFLIINFVNLIVKLEQKEQMILLGTVMSEVGLDLDSVKRMARTSLKHLSN